MNKEIECCQHGTSQTTYVCQHILGSAADKNPVGLHCMQDEAGDLQGFCTQCWDASDEEWEMLNSDGPRLLCLKCLEDVAVLNNSEIKI